MIIYYTLIDLFDTTYVNYKTDFLIGYCTIILIIAQYLI